MSFIIGLLTVVMVLNCLLLILLVIVQLPKKDAGAGLAFGGGASDALFGAGSGNMLTKITKWATVIFFVLTIILSLISVSYNKRQNSIELPKDFESQVKSAAPAPTVPAASAPTAPAATPLVVPTNGLLNIPTPGPTPRPTPVPAAASNAPAAK